MLSCMKGSTVGVASCSRPWLCRSVRLCFTWSSWYPIQVAQKLVVTKTQTHTDFPVKFKKLPDKTVGIGIYKNVTSAAVIEEVAPDLCISAVQHGDWLVCQRHWMKRRHKYSPLSWVGRHCPAEKTSWMSHHLCLHRSWATSLHLGSCRDLPAFHICG